MAHASEWFEHTNTQAFISQSLIYSSDYNFLSQSDDMVSADMWEAGALLSTQVLDELSFSGQLLGRKVSQASGNDVRIDYAFLSHPLYQTNNTLVTARLGRIRSSFGFYNETRDIPHTRTGIVMPQSIYYDQTRNSFYSADGLELHWSRPAGENTLTFQAFFSRPVVDEDEAAEAAALNPTNLQGDKSVLAKLSYGSEFEGLRAALTYYRPEYTVDVNPTMPFQMYADDSAFYSETVLTSLEYNQFDWAVTAEYSRHKFKSKVNLDWDQTVAGSSYLQSLDATTLEATRLSIYDTVKYLGYEESFYLQGLYRWDDSVETYIRYDYNRLRGASFADPQSHFVDINMGASWRPDSHWLVRGELHYIDGWSRLLSRDNQGPKSNRYWHTAMLQVAYQW